MRRVLEGTTIFDGEIHAIERHYFLVVPDHGRFLRRKINRERTIARHRNGGVGAVFTLDLETAEAPVFTENAFLFQPLIVPGDARFVVFDLRCNTQDTTRTDRYFDIFRLGV